MADPSASLLALLAATLCVGCSGGASETAPQPAAGAEETASPETAAPETAALETVEPETVEPEEEHEVADATPPVCARFSFDLRSMPHTGPRQVNEGLIQSRVNGLIQSVRDAAGPPLVQTFGSPGSSSFSAVFSGAANVDRCERVRASVAPPVPEGVTGRRVFSYERASECGPCAPEILGALQQAE